MKAGRKITDSSSKEKSARYSQNLSGKLREMRLKVIEARHLNEALIASIGDGVIVVDEYGVITNINETVRRILGYQHEDLIGKGLTQVLPINYRNGEAMPTLERPSMRALISGVPVSAVIEFTRKDGEQLPVATTAAPFIIDHKPKGAIIVFRDFSREIAVEKAKDEFVSLASHQLRTPLTSIRMYSEMIKDDPENNLSPELALALDKISASTEKMLNLVSDFLSISKLELGRFDINWQRVNIHELVRSQITEAMPLLAEKSIKVEFSRPITDLTALTDPSLLSQVIHNLLTNAIRYSEKGSINITLKKSGRSYLLAIADKGIGIPEEAKAKIFERLYRAPNAIELLDQGTGLGLYLVKKIVETLGGQVWFESQEAKGTTFFVKLPLKTTAA
jgi:PAS domain S-box-containing protein